MISIIYLLSNQILNFSYSFKLDPIKPKKMWLFNKSKYEAIKEIL